MSGFPVENTPMANRGAWAIAAMFLVGLVLAGGSVLYHHQKGRRALEFWGAADAELIRHAPEVELLELAPLGAEEAAQTQGEASERLTVGDRPFRITRRKSIAQARGLVHARHAFIIDANYDWSAARTPPTGSAEPQWSHALVFRREDRQVTLAFAFDQGLLQQLDSHKTAVLQPTIAAAEKALLLRELPP
ncbi:MAG: hypothetical protein U0939_10470 [Pirellulales bacterium]